VLSGWYFDETQDIVYIALRISKLYSIDPSQEFEDHARGRDRSQGCRTLFELPYAIDGDKVGGQSIKLFCHKEEAWTKALKFMAADLKFALKWVITEHDKALSVALSARSATRSTWSSALDEL
jgi:hypothetical protein